MAFMADDDYALALRLQEEFDNESAITVRDDSTSVRKKWPISGDVGERRPTPQAPSSLIDSSWELIDPNPDVRALFLEFNDKFFWGGLGGVEVKWSPRMTLCAGVCVYEGRGGMCSIRLSLPLLKLRPRKDLVETLLHEMIHAYLFVTNNDRDRDGHGPEFLKHMHRLNKTTGTRISVYHDFHDEVNHYQTHWWRCDGPCQSRKPYFGYVKRAMNRAPSSRDPWWPDHQRTCGGTYTKIKEPEDYGVKKNKRTQQDKAETKDKTSTNSVLANWLQTTSTQPKSSTSGRGLELLDNGSSVSISSIDKTASSAARGVPDIVDVAFISDDELLFAVDELEKNLAASQQQQTDKNSNKDRWNVNGKTERISEDCDNVAGVPIARKVPSMSSNVKELPESSLNKLEFPGKGIVLGSKSSTNSHHQQPSSSAGQVLRRLPGFGLIEVKAAVDDGKMLKDAEIREVKDEGKISTQRTNNVNSDELIVSNHNEALSQKQSKNDNRCTNDAQSKLNCLSTQGNRKSSKTSTDRINKSRINNDTGCDKAKTDVRFWLSDQSRAVGEVVRVPNFTSVGNPKFRRKKEEQENALPSVKIPRQSDDKDDARPSKKIRLGNELDFKIAETSRHINSSETNRAGIGAWGRPTNVDSGRGRIVDDNRKTNMGNDRGRNADDGIRTVDNSRGTKVDKGRTMSAVNSREQKVENDRETIVDVSKAAGVESSRMLNMVNSRTYSFDHLSVVKTDSITLYSDDSDCDETQTIASVISRIKASVSIDDSSSKSRGGGPSSETITSVEPPQVADPISGSIIPQISPGHSDSQLSSDVPCPACGCLVDVAVINEHLDSCLN